MAILFAAALRGIQRLIDGKNDVGHGRLIHRAVQLITTARPARTHHQAAAPEFAEQLLKVGQRNPLPLADSRQSNRALVLAHGNIEHRRHRKPSLSRQSHESLNLMNRFDYWNLDSTEVDLKNSRLN